MTRIYRSAQGERAVLDRYRQFLDHWPANMDILVD